MARNVRVVTGPAYAPQDRAEAFADALTARALRPRTPHQGGPVQVAMNPWEGVAQLGEAGIAAALSHRANKLAEADQQRKLSANSDMIRQLAGTKTEDRAPMATYGQQVPNDERIQALTSAMAGMDPGAANQVLSGQVLQRTLGDPKEDEAYTLTPGSARFKGDKQIAAMPTEAKQPDLPEGMRINPQTGQPEWIPGYLQAKERLAAAGRSTTSISYDPDGSNRYGAPPAGYYRPDPSRPDIAMMPGSPQQSEAASTAEKEQARRESSVIKATGVVGEIDKALGLTRKGTAGFWGAATRNLSPFEGAGTDALTLARTVDTVKANLGFDELQKMRLESPTGGALGQVAVQELQALQSTVANLDPNLPPDVLKQNLKTIRDRYSRWLMTTQGQMPPPLGTEMSPVQGIDSYMQKYGGQR